jgi:hypothetical protein
LFNHSLQPIPLDLLTLANFTDAATQRSTGIFKIRGGQQHAGDQSGVTPITPDGAGDSRAVYPCTIHHNGRMGGLNTIYAESSAARAEWKAKLEEATGLRKVVQESNKVFEIETLSTDTFLVPSMLAGAATPSWNHENSFTGKVTCSVPFGKCTRAPQLSPSVSLIGSMSQLLLMGEPSLQSDVLKVFGSASGTIQDVSRAECGINLSSRNHL